MREPVIGLIIPVETRLHGARIGGANAQRLTDKAEACYDAGKDARL